MRLVSVLKLAAVFTVVGASAATAQTQVAVEVRLGAYPRPYVHDVWRYDRYDRWNRYSYSVPVTRCFTRGRWVRCRTAEVVVVPRHRSGPPRHHSDRNRYYRGR